MRVPNAQQQNVIQDLDNHILLFAGAGTGKTFTLANRVSAIINSGRALPDEILCLTFTIKACGEMREDIARYVGNQAKETMVKTIHGFCYALLSDESKRRGDMYSNVAICDEVDEEELLRGIFACNYPRWRAQDRGEQTKDREYEPHTFAVFERKNALMSLVSELKHARRAAHIDTGDEEKDYAKALQYIQENRSATWADLTSYFIKNVGQVCDETYKDAVLQYGARLCAEYQRRLRQSNLVDFDDLILLSEKYLSENDTRLRWAKKYKYIIVDEVQDTSLLEYAVLEKICSCGKVMFCGDLFQTIYAWRGSCPDEVLPLFVQKFSPKRYVFWENYRSTERLTNAAFGYLQNAYPQQIKEYYRENMVACNGQKGEKILCCAFDNREEEAWQIYQYISSNPPVDPSTVCIMARTNAYIAQLSRYFQRFNAERDEKDRLRFFTVDENHRFFKRAVVKDILAVLRLTASAFDNVSMERLAVRYIRGVGLSTAAKLRDFSTDGVSITSFLSADAYACEDIYAPLLSAWEQGRVVVYDTETTGLDLTKDQAVQISAVRLRADGSVEQTLDLMVEPTVAISQGAYQTHGFDLEYIRKHGGQSAKQALKTFSEFVKGCVLVGHNSLRFDAPLLRRQCRENGLPPLQIEREYDTMELAKLFCPRLPNFRLSTLCEQFGVVNMQAHNALGDIVATGKCLTALIERYVLPTAARRKEILQGYRDKFSSFYAFIAQAKEMLAHNALDELLPFIVEKMMLKKRYPDPADRDAIQDVMQSLCIQTDDAERVVTEYLHDASVSGSQMDLLLKKLRRIPIITVHQAKGCEFETVLLAGVDEDHFPCYMTKGGKYEDEEKKLFYVAITRAKNKLIMTRAAYNGRYDKAVSPYWQYIPKNYVKCNADWLHK